MSTTNHKACDFSNNLLSSSHLRTHPNALKAYAQKEILITSVEWKTFAELQNHDRLGYTRILGMPCSLQSEMDPSGFIMQGGEMLGLSGDRLLYLYADNVTAQVT